MRLLLVCSENRLRSPTAAAIFEAYDGVEAIGAGTNADADTPASGDLIQWADAILVMEESHRSKISTKFKPLISGKKLAVMGIPDKFKYMQPELVSLLKKRVPKYVAL